MKALQVTCCRVGRRQARDAIAARQRNIRGLALGHQPRHLLLTQQRCRHLNVLRRVHLPQGDMTSISVPPVRCQSLNLAAHL